MTSLLDVNVLISLLDANHDHHAAVMGWFSQNKGHWASCPITQNGYLQIVTNVSYPNTISIQQAIWNLEQAVSTSSHQFLYDNVSLLNGQLVKHRHIQGHKQFTDVYLLALAVSHGVQFVTIDRKIPRNAVPLATSASMHVIIP